MTSLWQSTVYETSTNMECNCVTLTFLNSIIITKICSPCKCPWPLVQSPDCKEKNFRICFQTFLCSVASRWHTISRVIYRVEWNPDFSNPRFFEHCNFTPDFLNCTIFQINFHLPWRFKKSRIHCIFWLTQQACQNIACLVYMHIFEVLHTSNL